MSFKDVKRSEKNMFMESFSLTHVFTISGVLFFCVFKSGVISFQLDGLPFGISYTASLLTKNSLSLCSSETVYYAFSFEG